MKAALEAQGALADVIAKHAGKVTAANGTPILIDRPAVNGPSVTYDAIFLPGGPGAAAVAHLGLAVHAVAEAFTHGKPIAAVGDASAVLTKADVPTGPAAAGVVAGLIAATGHHRFARRATDAISA